MAENGRTPRLRFKGFNDDWKQCKINEISYYMVSSLTADDCIEDGRYKLYDANGVIGKTNQTPQNQKYITIIKDGSGVGRVRKLPQGSCYIGTMGAIKPLGSDFDFLFCLLEKLDFSKYINGATIPHIYYSEYGNEYVKTPSEDEQAVLGKFHRRLDELIVVYQRKYEKLVEIKKSLLENMFPTDGESAPKIRLKGYNGSWKRRKFDDIVLIERGGSPRPIEEYITTDLDGLNWVKIGDAPKQGSYITSTAEKIKPSGLSKTRQVIPGDLILSNSMSFGRPYIMAINGCIHDGWLLIRDENRNFDKEFLCCLLGTEQMLRQYKSLAGGSTVNNLNKELVGNTWITYPTMDEQREIGKFMSNLDNLIALQSQTVDKLRNIKSALLEKMFV